jgi:hypothetical protein
MNESRYHVSDPVIGTYDFYNPDFNFGEFRSNLVLKWDYNLGSVFYFVWTHNRTSEQKISNMAQSENFKNLWHIGVIMYS